MGTLNGLCVLVVEDEFLIALEMQTVLEDAGATVTVAHDLPSGLRAADGLAAGETLFDLAVLDVRLGDDLVFPVADRLASEGVPFIFHSGHARLEDLVARYPESQLLAKPTPAGRLVDAVAGLAAPESATRAAAV